MKIESSSFFGQIVSSNASLIRALAFILGLFIIAALVWVGVNAYVLNNKSDVKLQFSEEGATIVITPNDITKAQFLLPASNRWTNTGIKIKGKSKVKFQASGKAHLAVHTLIHAAEVDSLPAFDWVTPEGRPYSSTSRKDLKRRQLLIHPNANVGCIIGYFQEPGDPIPSSANLKPSDLFVIGEGAIVNKNDEESVLWLIVNDVHLDPNDEELSKAAYVGPSEDKRGRKKQTVKNWEYIVQNSYWHIWYDDNVGHYLVQLEELEESDS